MPVLAASMLERLATMAAGRGTISKPEVDNVAEEMLEHPPAHLEQLWDDCGFELRSNLAALAQRESEGVLLPEYSTQRQRALPSNRWILRLSGDA